MRVLVVDDNSSSREIFKEMLETMFFEVAVAASAREGIAELTAADASDPFQLVLMDWQMPEMDGLKAARIIRESTPLKHPPKIILVTAYGYDLVSDQAEQAGLLGVLVKPISNSMLFDNVMHAFMEGTPEAGQAAVRRRSSIGRGFHRPTRAVGRRQRDQPGTRQPVAA